MATSRMTEQLGRVLGGRYRLIAPIGTGASAQVFLADDVTLRRRVAVKVLHPALADDEAFLRRFRAEARSAAALSHPNLMAVYDWGEDDGPYLVTEFLGGGSLRALLDRGSRLSASQALVVGVDAARALDVAHRRGFVHRDIKPANILFGEDERLRIADFGLARALSEAAWTEPGDGLVGTARYAAPEQGGGGRVDGKADVYALGLVVVESITGAVPLSGDSALATIMARAERDGPVPDAVGPLAPVLTDALRSDPDRRPDAGALAARLLDAARQLARPAPLPLPGAVDVDGERLRERDDPTLLPRAAAPPAAPAPADDITVIGAPASATRVFDDLALADDDRGAADVPAAGRARRRGRRWPWVALALLLVAGVAAGGALAWYQLQPASAAVPPVTGLPEADARERLAAAQAEEDGLEWDVVVEPQYNENVREGVVIDQKPDDGSMLDDGGTVKLIVSRGPPPRTIPDVERMTEEQAAAALAEAELAVGDVTRQHHEEVPAGQVLTWSFDGQDRPTELPKGSEVDLLISDGPAPRAVPDVAGMKVKDAEARLAQEGLGAEVVEEFSKTVEKGVVIASQPAAGTAVERGRVVTLRVSKGRDLVKVPDVNGQSLEQAVATLEKAGLEPGQVFGPANGRADSTDPEKGAQVDRGTTVDIYLRR